MSAERSGSGQTLPLSVPVVSLAVVVLTLACALLPPAAQQALSLQRGALVSAPWAPWTHALVYFNLTHLALDLAVLAATGWVVEALLGRARLVQALLLGAPFIGLGALLLSPAVSVVRGSSGLCYLTAVLAVVALWRHLPAWRWCIALGVGARVLMPLVLPMAELHRLDASIRVLWEAHVLGGVLAPALLWVWLRAPAQPARPSSCAR